jgi:hypothetical protein
MVDCEEVASETDSVSASIFTADESRFAINEDGRTEMSAVSGSLADVERLGQPAILLRAGSTVPALTES